MIDEIYEGLKKRYNTVKVVLAAKWLSDEMEDKQCENYDIPLLTIFYTDLSEEPTTERRLIQLRVRDDCEGRGEELVMVFPTTGASKIITDIDEALVEASKYLEKFTEEFLTKFPDVVYRWEWLGDNLE